MGIMKNPKGIIMEYITPIALIAGVYFLWFHPSV